MGRRRGDSAADGGSAIAIRLPIDPGPDAPVDLTTVADDSLPRQNAGIITSGPGGLPYPETMNRAAVDEMLAAELSRRSQSVLLMGHHQ
jgi:hypothetical protein